MVLKLFLLDLSESNRTSFFFFNLIFKVNPTPNVGLELTTQESYILSTEPGTPRHLSILSHLPSIA